MSHDDRDQPGGHKAGLKRHPVCEPDCHYCKRLLGIGKRPPMGDRHAIKEGVSE